MHASYPFIYTAQRIIANHLSWMTFKILLVSIQLEFVRSLGKIKKYYNLLESYEHFTAIANRMVDCSQYAAFIGIRLFTSFPSPFGKLQN